MYSLLLLGLILAAAAASIAAAGHALLWKRDPRAALGWIVVSVTLPIAGPLLYFVFGVNRIQTRARSLRISSARQEGDAAADPPRTDLPPEFSELAGISRAVSTYELTAGNRIEVLHNGDYRLLGSRLVNINGERQVIEISGTCRARDIGPDNSILSTYISDAKIAYNGTGAVNAVSEPGVLTKIVNWLF